MSRRGASHGSSSSSTALAIPNLVVRRNEYGVEVPYTDQPHIHIIANIIDRALLVLESPTGRAALANVGQQIVLGRLGVGLYPASSDPNFAQMSHYVNLFLRSLRRDFPNVVLEPIAGGHEAEFDRADWTTQHRLRPPFAPSLELFRASDGGTMHLDSTVSATRGQNALLPVLDISDNDSRSWTRCSGAPPNETLRCTRSL